MSHDSGLPRHPRPPFSALAGASRRGPAVQPVHGSGGCLSPRELVDQAVGGDDLIRMEQQEGEQRALLRSSKCRTRPSSLTSSGPIPKSIHSSVGALLEPGKGRSCIVVADIGRVGDRAMKEAEMGARNFLFLVGLAMVAADVHGRVSRQPPAFAAAVAHLGRVHTVDTTAQSDSDCKPISKRNPAVMTCEVSGFTLIYSGSLQSQGGQRLPMVINCSPAEGGRTVRMVAGGGRGVDSGAFSSGRPRARARSTRRGGVVSGVFDARTLL